MDITIYGWSTRLDLGGVAANRTEHGMAFPQVAT